MRIYFLGICGSAMGNVALLMRSLGHEVIGADTGIYPPMSDNLIKNNVQIHEGYDADRLDKISPDLIVIGNALSRGNPEIEYILESRKFRFISMAELLSEQILSQRHNIVVTGTHGKTTTTALAAFLLNSQGVDAGYMIGGIPKDFPLGSAMGSAAAPFVIEGDEYDTAFFDKRSKFIHYNPKILVINNIEFDHADIFRDLIDIKRSFTHLVRLIPRNGYILLNGDDANVLEVTQTTYCNTFTVGFGDHDLKISDFIEHATGSSFRFIWQGKPWAVVDWNLSGAYNARNLAMAALASALSIYPNDPTRFPIDSVKNFKGVKRRQEVLHQEASLVLIEDFGHHPTAIKEVLASLRQKYPDHRITACFEPRSNTAAINIHQEELANALSSADTAFIAPIHRLESIPEGKRLSTKMLESNLKNCRAFVDFDSLYDSLRELERSPAKQLVCFFSNGTLGGVMQKWTEQLNLTPQSV